MLSLGMSCFDSRQSQDLGHLWTQEDSVKYWNVLTRRTVKRGGIERHCWGHISLTNLFNTPGRESQAGLCHLLARLRIRANQSPLPVMSHDLFLNCRVHTV